MCDRLGSHFRSLIPISNGPGYEASIFRSLRCFTLTRKASTVLIQCSVIESTDGGIMKAVDKRQYCAGVASLSVFGGNFVLAKVCRGLISVRCLELRGVRFSVVRNVLVLWYN